MTNNQRAVAIYKASNDVADLLDGMVLALEQAEERGRRKGLEEAAEVTTGMRVCSECGHATSTRGTVERIRALADARDEQEFSHPAEDGKVWK